MRELAERWQERRAVSRRGFLKASAAASAGVMAASCGGTSHASNDGRGVVVVGGGIAGLHCAFRLKQLGLNPYVFDANDRLGGRMFTDRQTFPNGQHCELGGELIGTGHETLRDLADEFDLTLLDYSTLDPSLSHLRALFGGKLIPEADVLEGYAPIAAAIDDALSVLHDPDGYITYHDPNGAEALDQLSMSAWFDSIGASGPVRQLLEVAYVGEYGLEADVTNVLNLMLLISTDTTNFEIFGDSDERFHTASGNDSFPSRLAGQLDPTRIFTGHRLIAIRQLGDGRYETIYQRDSGTVAARCDHLVLALPFTLLREVDIFLPLPDVKRNAIQNLGYGTNSKLMCGFDSRYWYGLGSDGETYSDLGYQNTWDTSRLQVGDTGILTNFVGGQAGIAMGDGTTESQRDAFLTQIEQVLPGAAASSNGATVRYVWPTFALTKGSYASYKVGQYSTIAGAEIERFDNVHFCGEHTSLDFQGYMEGGALTGAMAADEIAADMGLTPAAATLSAPARRVMQRARTVRASHKRLAALRRAQRGR